MTHNIMRMLVLSTGHLTGETVRLLDTTPVLSERYPVMGAPIPYGFLVYAHDDGEDGIPPDLWACCAYARRLGCDYIRFDAEEELADGLEDHSSTHGSTAVELDTADGAAPEVKLDNGRLTADAAIAPAGDDAEADACSDCGVELAEAGDGYDGLCPTCADSAAASA